MKKYNLICPIREANPYRRMAKAMRTDNVFDNSLNREFKALGPRMALMTDITYISKEDGFCYLSTIIDGYTKQILSYVLSDSLELDFVLETIEILMKTHGEELTKDTIIHSDQGSHYTSYKFIDVLKDNELRQSMSRRGNCWDNAPQESFFGHMKSELRLSKKMTYDEIKDAIEAWIDYYNNDRYQWQLGKLSPNEYYEYITTGYSPLLEIDIQKATTKNTPILQKQKVSQRDLMLSTKWGTVQDTFYRNALWVSGFSIIYEFRSIAQRPAKGSLCAQKTKSRRSPDNSSKPLPRLIHYIQF